MSDLYRKLNHEAYSEWSEDAADDFVAAQREAFLAGFEAAADEAREFRRLRTWLEEARDEALEDANDDRMMNGRRMAFSEVLVKLHQMGCAPDSTDVAKEADDE